MSFIWDTILGSMIENTIWVSLSNLQVRISWSSICDNVSHSLTHPSFDFGTHRDILDTFDLWDIWSEWWESMTWPKKDNDRDNYKYFEIVDMFDNCEHYNHSDLTIKTIQSDTGQHSQFLWWFYWQSLFGGELLRWLSGSGDPDPGGRSPSRNVRRPACLHP